MQHSSRISNSSISSKLTSSLLVLPPELWQHHIFMNLDLASSTSCSLACSFFRKIFKRILIINSENYFNFDAKSQRQVQILKCIFRGGFLTLLVWFQSCMKFPLLNCWSNVQVDCLTSAAEGQSYNSFSSEFDMFRTADLFSI